MPLRPLSTKAQAPRKDTHMRQLRRSEVLVISKCGQKQLDACKFFGAHFEHSLHLDWASKPDAESVF